MTAAPATTALCLGARVRDRKTASAGTIIDEVQWRSLPASVAAGECVTIYYRVDLDAGGEAWPRQASDLERLE